MLMKRIYTEKETIRFFPLYLLIPVIVVALYGFSEYGFSKIAYIYIYIYIYIGCALILWLLVGVLFFFIWFPNEHKLICAKRHGKVYIGTVKSVRIKGEKRYGVHSRKYAYVIILSIVVNEQEHIIESENFYSDPSKYITTGDKIKVFYYNNKFYPEFVYEKNKNHKQSKDRASI